MRGSRHLAVGAAAFLAGAALALGSGTALAAVVPAPAKLAAAPEILGSGVELVQRYDRRRHGHRYRHRRPGYGHFYGGFWYGYPWWHRPVRPRPPRPPIYSGGANSHVRWCLNRYRSYDPRTNTFLGYDGYRHRCRSPYGY